MEQLIDHAGHVQLEQQESQHVLSTERSVEPPPNSAEIDAANPNPADLLPEADGAARDPYSVKRWLSWAEAVRRSEQPAASEFSVLERAVAALPGSYKLWQLYATRAHMIARAYHPEHASRELSVNVALRAARALRTAPRLWEEAISICEREGRLAAARVALDDALRALPVTQHDRIWRTALSGISALPSRASVSVLERYQTLRPLLAALPLFDARVRARKWDAAVSGLLRVLAANPTWVPVGDRTRGELWVAAMHLAVQHPAAVVSVDAPMLLRNALREGPDAAHGLQTADLYKLLARYHMRLGRFDDARAVYEEAVTTVRSVRDFALLYDAYAKFEEGLINVAMEELDEIRGEGNAADPDELREVEEGLERLMSDLEKLADRRPMLLSDVWLRQNPHNVHEWHKRARLLKKSGDATAVVAAYTQAVRTVDAHSASNGRPHTLWLAFASYYESANDADSARKVLDKAVSEPGKFAHAQDLAAVWCEYAEMELRLSNPRRALELLKTATTQPAEDRRRALRRSGGTVKGAHGIVYYDHRSAGNPWVAWRSNRLWSFLLDLTESLETPSAVSSVYDRLIDAGCATAQNVLNGADWLSSHRHFEQAFRLYERGAAALQWPSALQVWATYLRNFLRRHGRDAQRRERARSLFEAALSAAPPTRRFGRDIPSEHLTPLYTSYASAEERYLGAPRRALAVLARACRAVRSTDRADMYRIRAARASVLLGAPRARAVYEDALRSLPARDDVLAFAIRFAALETSLGELDRARAIFRHSARAADPRAPVDAHTPSATFWKAWHDLELAHGAEDSFRDMLRARRAVLLHSAVGHLPTSAAAGAGTVEMAASRVASDTAHDAVEGDAEVVNVGVDAEGGSARESTDAEGGSARESTDAEGDSVRESVDEEGDAARESVDVEEEAAHKSSDSTGGDGPAVQAPVVERVNDENAGSKGSGDEMDDREDKKEGVFETKRKRTEEEDGDLQTVNAKCGVKKTMGALERFKRQRQ